MLTTSTLQMEREFEKQKQAHPEMDDNEIYASLILPEGAALAVTDEKGDNFSLNVRCEGEQAF